jgi:hypothetical protein
MFGRRQLSRVSPEIHRRATCEWVHCRGAAYRLISAPSGLFLCSASYRILLQLQKSLKSSRQFQTEFRRKILHVSSCKIAKDTGDMFALPHVLSDSLRWYYQAGVRLKLNVTTTQYHRHKSHVLTHWCSV